MKNEMERIIEWNYELFKLLNARLVKDVCLQYRCVFRKYENNINNNRSIVTLFKEHFLLNFHCIFTIFLKKKIKMFK